MNPYPAMVLGTALVVVLASGEDRIGRRDRKVSRRLSHLEPRISHDCAASRPNRSSIARTSRIIERRWNWDRSTKLSAVRSKICCRTKRRDTRQPEARKTDRGNQAFRAARFDLALRERRLVIDLRAHLAPLVSAHEVARPEPRPKPPLRRGLSLVEPPP